VGSKNKLKRWENETFTNVFNQQEESRFISSKKWNKE
jgi:hypothetical protein